MRALDKYCNFTKETCFNPTEACKAEVVLFLVQRSEETSYPNIMESDLHVIKCFQCNATKPLGPIPLVAPVTKDLIKIIEATI